MVFIQKKEYEAPSVRVISLRNKSDLLLIDSNTIILNYNDNPSDSPAQV